ncbi:hypothetical protein [Variovorax ginsengisoli]|uniref:Uncharacterized protein n=1 Tax=Variovorax ginsengisoli TaxID=363844 RepID=A0ABT8SFD6_9BURK|nr:hypothetical protein [Variovorax ginsengisoli]MDN8618471.1 hypothetical protein [Variovorax ginsengisoli]MDO1537641.1 hypothetical protein [Variovorax ginsengisoli]
MAALARFKSIAGALARTQNTPLPLLPAHDSQNLAAKFEILPTKQ